MRTRTIRLIAASALGVALAFVVPSVSNNVVAAPEHKHGNEKHKLGKNKIGDVEVSVITTGEVEPGAHVDFSIKVFTLNEPKALRVWIGTESAEGSKKAEGKKGSTDAKGILYTGEVDAPKPIPAGSLLWVELETDKGTQKASWNYDVHDHKH